MEHPADMSRKDYLRDQLWLIHEEMGEMLEHGSFQALVAARRISLTYRTELDNMARDEMPDFEPRALADVVSEVLKLPDALFADPSIVERVAAAAIV